MAGPGPDQNDSKDKRLWLSPTAPRSLLRQQLPAAQNVLYIRSTNRHRLIWQPIPLNSHYQDDGFLCDMPCQTESPLCRGIIYAACRFHRSPIDTMRQPRYEYAAGVPRTTGIIDTTLRDINFRRPPVLPLKIRSAALLGNRQPSFNSGRRSPAPCTGARLGLKWLLHHGRIDPFPSLDALAPCRWRPNHPASTTP